LDVVGIYFAAGGKQQQVVCRVNAEILPPVNDLAGNADGAGGGRKPASKGGNDLQSLLGNNTEAKPSASAAAEAKKNTKISSELEAALRRNGLSNLSLFEIVHSQYVKQSPMMKGIQKKAETFDNPLEAKNNLPAKGM
jgi:hypothetical protein